jgi:hypothetical protein
VVYEAGEAAASWEASGSGSDVWADASEDSGQEGQGVFAQEAAAASQTPTPSPTPTPSATASHTTTPAPTNAFVVGLGADGGDAGTRHGPLASPRPGNPATPADGTAKTAGPAQGSDAAPSDHHDPQGPTAPRAGMSKAAIMQITAGALSAVAIIALSVLGAVLIRRRAAARALQAVLVVSGNPAAGLSRSQVLMFGTKGQYIQQRGMKVDAGVVCPTGDKKTKKTGRSGGGASGGGGDGREGKRGGTHVVPRASTLKALQESTHLPTVVKDARGWSSGSDGSDEL